MGATVRIHFENDSPQHYDVQVGAEPVKLEVIDEDGAVRGAVKIEKTGETERTLSLLDD